MFLVLLRLLLTLQPTLLSVKELLELVLVKTRVVGISGTTIYLDKALTGAASGTATFSVSAENLTTMAVSQTATPNGIAATTTIVGIDYETRTGEIGPRVL